MLTEYRDSKRSPLRKLDPRTLLVAAAGAAFCFSCVQSPASACLCLAFALILAACRRPPIRPLMKRLLAVNVFTLFLWLTVPLAVPGETVARLGPLSWSGEGAALALLATIKCNAVFLSFFALVAGTDPARIGCALEQLRVPAKLAFLFLFTCRYIHVVREEWLRLRTAAKLRGFTPRNSLHTYRTIGNMIGLAFINAIDRSRRIYEAMLLRGFGGTFRTATELRGSPADVLFSALFFCALGGILLLDSCLK